MTRMTISTCWIKLPFLFFGFLASFGGTVNGEEIVHSGTSQCRATRDDWAETMLASRAALQKLKVSEKDKRNRENKLWARVETDFPIQSDWVLQDAGKDFHNRFGNESSPELEKKMIARVLDEVGRDGAKSRAEFKELCAAEVAPSDRRWLNLYVRACEQRRGIRLKPLLEQCPKIVFTKHYNLGGSHYAYTEGQSDAQRERHFVPGASLCLLEMNGIYGDVRTLIHDPDGVIRDPAVSYDGERILFAWKKSDLKDDYHLYEIDVASGSVRQLTFGLGFADYEPAYLPNGDIVFNSTRCVQTVDCWWTEVSNLYTCDKDGDYLRRLTFDQVHTNYPTVRDDGRVIYTRWEYNDRGQIYTQPLFQMNSDGTEQTECYGNNSWFPTTIMHARGIPGSNKVVAILSGHHTHQRGKLAIIDTRKGRQEAAGVQLIAPVRETGAVRVDAYGQDGDQFQYPYPLSGTEFLVTYDPYGSGNGRYVRPYAIYFMTIDGRRELLASDPDISCNQPVPLALRKRPHLRPTLVDYRKKTGTYYLQDIYAGASLKGVARGTVKRLRVVGLEYRAAGVGENRNHGPAGSALISTPIAIGNGSWDVKVVLGDATVYEDGSACFTVPARTPVYFQALDEKGHAVQTMRSWSTLQPGEVFSCVGCHESKNSTPLIAKTTLAMTAGPKPLEPFYGPPRGFSFIKEIQPILDWHCVRCHNGRAESGEHKDGRQSPTGEIPFNLLGKQTADATAGRRWSESYLALTRRGQSNELVNWISAQSAPPALSPYHAGAARSRLIAMLETGHEDAKVTREELDKLACWIDLLVPFCGDYTEANAWSPEDVRKYNHFVQKRKRMEEIEQKNIEDLIAKRSQDGEAVNLEISEQQGDRDGTTNESTLSGNPAMTEHGLPTRHSRCKLDSSLDKSALLNR